MTARDILEKHFGNEGYSFERWAQGYAAGNDERAKSVLAAMKEAVELSWDTAQEKSFRTHMDGEERATFLNKLFPERKELPSETSLSKDTDK